MTRDCTKFHKVTKDEGCQQIADDNNISLTDFYAWNPAVGDNCSGLKYDYYVCVDTMHTASPTAIPATTPTATRPTPITSGDATPTPTQSGMTDGCTAFHKVVKDEWCEQIAKDSGVSLSNFVAWNPAVGDDCKGLKYGYYVCVGKDPAGATPTPSSQPSSTDNSGGVTPTPVQAGMIKGCKTFHKVERDEYCYMIVDQYHISLPSFETWNPAIGSNCEGLKYDYYVCVGV
jgi:sarcosine oxidase delta subunit